MTREQRDAHERMLSTLPTRVVSTDAPEHRGHFHFRRRAGHKLTPEEREELKKRIGEMREKGLTRVEMHRLTGASLKSIARILGPGVRGGARGTRKK